MTWRFTAGATYMLACVLAIGCGPKPTVETVEKPDGDDAAETTPASPSPNSDADAEPAPEPTAPTTPEPPKEPAKATLGDPALTAGIPGEGELTDEAIKQWLETPGVHDPLQIQLPAGVAWGGPKGLDDNPMTRAKIELGRQLYFDTRLSADNSVSCASCHHPDHGYAFDTQFGVGIGGQEGGRNSPVAFNRIFSEAQFWDGRAATLEEQAVGPIANPIEMGNTHPTAVQTVASVPGYQMQFEAVFQDGVTIDNVGKAIAAFERTLITGPSPYDYYEPLRSLEQRYAEDLEDLEALKEDEPRIYERYVALKEASDAHPMSDSAKRGRDLFFGKAKCTDCHAGANFSDEAYHNLGIGMMADEPDVGRFAVTNKEEDTGAFKTPTCRNVTQTGPYMHDGSLNTLLEVVQWYNKGGHPNPYLSKKVVKLNLTEQEEQDVVAFMEALTGEFPKVEQGRLPTSPAP